MPVRYRSSSRSAFTTGSLLSRPLSRSSVTARAVIAWLRSKNRGQWLTSQPAVSLLPRGRDDDAVDLQAHGVVMISIAIGSPLAPWEPREPVRGANAFRLTRTRRDSARAFLQVRGSPFDSLRPGQTPGSCLGVKGSRVQIPPSRRIFERIIDAYSTEVQQSPGESGRLSPLAGR